MVSRRLVKSGNTSFTLSLPINWVRKNKLNAGSEVDLSESDQGNLIITSISSQNNKNLPTTKSISVDNKTSEEINLELLSAYTMDYGMIVMNGKEITQKSKDILDKMQNYIGFDVMEQTKNNMTIKNFFQLDEETKPENLLKKINVINRTSFQTLSVFFDRGFTEEELFELQKFKNQNRRLFILSRKGLLKLIQEPSLMRKTHLNNLQVMKYFIYSQFYSNISDQIYRTGDSLLLLDSTTAESKILNKIFDVVYKNYDYVINSINNNDVAWIKSFLVSFKKEKTRFEEDMKLLEDPVSVKACMSLLEINSEIRKFCFIFLM